MDTAELIPVRLPAPAVARETPTPPEGESPWVVDLASGRVVRRRQCDSANLIAPPGTLS